MIDTQIDTAALKKLLDVIGGDPEDLAELIEDFNAIGPELVEKIRTSGNVSDWDNMRIAAHTLKSNAREMGATQLATLCETLEHQLHSGPIDNPDEVSAAIEAEEASARIALNKLNIEDV